ncbi:MAG: hypothetical protein LQ349_008417 [Xanthoria aureola]|nr:MAG: hypothetical protein LQ349_008417 [Xanthoria aureola]
MHLSILFLLLTQTLSTLALPAASNGTSTLSIATYPSNYCRGSPAVHENITYNHIINGDFSSHRLGRDLESTEQLIFGTYYGNATVEGEDRMSGCHSWQLHLMAANFVLRGRAGALSSPDLGVQKSDGAGDGWRRRPELGIIVLLAGFCGYYVLAVAD